MYNTLSGGHGYYVGRQSRKRYKVTQVDCRWGCQTRPFWGCDVCQRSEWNEARSCETRGTDVLGKGDIRYRTCGIVFTLLRLSFYMYFGEIHLIKCFLLLHLDLAMDKNTFVFR